MVKRFVGAENIASLRFAAAAAAAGLAAAMLSACSSPTPSQPSAISSQAATTAATSSAVSGKQQLVFQDRSGTGKGEFASQADMPFGFWIWCQSISNNAYGNDCAGSIYFYKLGITTGLNGSISGNTVNVVSTPPNSSVSCTFTLPSLSTVTSGATNTVWLSCTNPQGSGVDSKVSIVVTPTS